MKRREVNKLAMTLPAFKWEGLKVSNTFMETARVEIRLRNHKRKEKITRT